MSSRSKQAYQVQAQLLQLRAMRGERLIGLKMGFTSEAKRAQMKIDDLIWGRLTDAMRIGSGGTLALSHFIHPRIEPELAFLLETPLRGAVSAEQARAAIGAWPQRWRCSTAATATFASHCPTSSPTIPPPPPSSWANGGRCLRI